jgi:hypothetical protein
MTSPIVFTQASAVYRSGAATVDLKIIDGGGNPRLFAPFAGLMASGFRTDSGNGFERSATIRNAPGWEKWDSGTRNGELGVAVSRRFLVQLEGHDVETIEALHTLVDAADLDGLASLR